MLKLIINVSHVKQDVLLVMIWNLVILARLIRSKMEQEGVSQLLVVLKEIIILRQLANVKFVTLYVKHARVLITSNALHALITKNLLIINVSLNAKMEPIKIPMGLVSLAHQTV